MSSAPRFRDALGWPDALLAAGGIIGFLLVVIVGSREHPHSAATEHISRAAAVDSARAIAQRHGAVQLDDAVPEARIRYDGDLLNALQRRYGRDEAIAMLNAEDSPGYTWEVKWTEPTDADSESIGWTRITLNGRFVAMRVEPSAIARQARHTEALSQVTGGLIPMDSLAPDRLTFRLDSSAPRNRSLRDQDMTADRLFLSRSDAEEMALFHLRRSVFVDDAVQVDSVFASGEDGITTATVRVSNHAEDPGEFFAADIEVMPSGILTGLEPSFIEDSEDELNGLGSDAVIQLSVFVLYSLLALAMIVLFFRRLHARVVDTKTAIRDGMIAGLAAAVAMSSHATTNFEAGWPMEIVGMLLGMALVGLSGGVLMFFISGAALSVARERWDDKLQTLALVRNMYVRNVPVGASVLRGALVGLVLAGLIPLVLLAFGGVWLHFSGSGDALYGELSPPFATIRDAGGDSYRSLFMTFAVVLGIGGMAARFRGRAVWSSAAIVLMLAALQASPIDLRPLPFTYALSALYGAAIVAIFWKYDALATLLAFLVSVLTVGYMSSWSAPGSPEFIAAVLGTALVTALLVLGVVGVMSEKRSSEVPVIIPEYIKELAQQERLKRELELAREVQLSFLPSRTPDVPGLDLASICLPANEVGGDYYDFFRMKGNRIGVVVGDVSGKGMQAAFYMTLMKGILQSLNTSLTQPAEILTAANALFRTNAPRGIFMSIVLGVIDLDDRTWTCARAGHNPMLIHRAGAERPEEIKPRGAAIGLASDPTFSESIEEVTVPLGAGDLLLIYTDGITEAMNRRHELFSEERLDKSVSKAGGRRASEVLASIIEDVEAFTGNAPRNDDMTMVAIRMRDHAE